MKKKKMKKRRNGNMRNITMTPTTIEEMCIKLKEQLAGAYIGKDNYTVSIPTKLKIA